MLSRYLSLPASLEEMIPLEHTSPSDSLFKQKKTCAQTQDRSLGSTSSKAFARHQNSQREGMQECIGERIYAVIYGRLKIENDHVKVRISLETTPRSGETRAFSRGRWVTSAQVLQHLLSKRFFHALRKAIMSGECDPTLGPYRLALTVQKGKKDAINTVPFDQNSIDTTNSCGLFYLCVLLDTNRSTTSQPLWEPIPPPAGETCQFLGL